MSLNRREFIHLMGLAAAAGLVPGCDNNGQSSGDTSTKGAGSTAGATARSPEELYDIKPFGNVSIMHMTDCHAQLNPVYFREPNVNLGVGPAYGQPPHLVGDKLLKQTVLKRTRSHTLVTMKRRRNTARLVVLLTCVPWLRNYAPITVLTRHY